MTLVNSLVVVEKGESKEVDMVENMDEIFWTVATVEVEKARKVNPDLDVSSFLLGFSSGWRTGMEQARYMIRSPARFPTHGRK